MFDSEDLARSSGLDFIKISSLVYTISVWRGMVSLTYSSNLFFCFKLKRHVLRQPGHTYNWSCYWFLARDCKGGSSRTFVVLTQHFWPSGPWSICLILTVIDSSDAVKDDTNTIEKVKNKKKEKEKKEVTNEVVLHVVKMRGLPAQIKEVCRIHHWLFYCPDM